MADLRFLTLHGDRVAYRDEGGGDETLLMIHGIAGSSSAWEPVMSSLATSYRVLAPDLLGHGASDKPSADYTLPSFAAWLRDFLNALQVDAVTIVGHSLGGGVALQFVHQYRPYCRRLVLINSGGLGADVGVLLRILSAPGGGVLLPIISSQTIARIADRVRSGFTRRPTAPEAADEISPLSSPQARQAFLSTLRSVVDHRGQVVSAVSRLHSAAGVPTMFIAGGRDRIIPAAHTRAAHEAVGGSWLHVIDDAGHEPHVERPGVVSVLIRDFVDHPDPRGG
jgi:pimeloyl-ACP methyl ester carboxylesterase